jgi:hypothetical protein
LLFGVEQDDASHVASKILTDDRPRAPADWEDAPADDWLGPDLCCA